MSHLSVPDKWLRWLRAPIWAPIRAPTWAPTWARGLAPILAGCLLAGCMTPGGGPNRARHPDTELVAAGWIEAELIGDAAADDADRLARLDAAGPRGRVLRLDRLLDLYDAARFAGDADARASLWAALGGYSSARGIDASREVVLRLIDEAFALEELANADPDALDDDAREFLADAIMMLSADMFLPDSAESLVSQTLAYRVLTETGHLRIADNAHWRLYDHVRGVLEGAVEIGPELRRDVLVHALYAEREDLSAWLDDRAPHAQPPLPSPAELWALLAEHRDALAEHPRWRAVVETRASAEAELRDTVLALLPRSRELDWTLPVLARGTGRPESLAPVIVLRPGEVVLEPGAEKPRPFPVEAASGPLVTGVEGVLARDGRGTLLIAADPQLPAPEYAAALSAVVAARASTLEFAVHEPRLPTSDDFDDFDDEDGLATEASGNVVVALPLYVARADDASPGVRALRGARIEVQLSGRGSRFRVDGRWLSATPALPSDIESLAVRLRDAYPRERVIRLTLAADVQPRQVVDLLAALSGGRDPAFLAVGWLPDSEPEIEPSGDPKADRTLDRRRQLGRSRLSATFPRADLDALSADDRARLEQAGSAVFACVPELEAELPRAGLGIELDFRDGELSELRSHVPRALARSRAAQLERLEGCARERLLGLRLRDRLEPTTVTLTIVAGEPS